MDALLVTFLACLLCESGGALSALAAGLSRRYARASLIMIGLVAAAFANTALAAVGGAFVGQMMAGDARSLFLAIALMFGGAGLLFPVKPPDLLEGWRIGALPTAFLGLAILGFGNGAQFIVMGIAVRTGDALWAAVGGALGAIVACAPTIMLRDQPVSPALLLYTRRTGGALLLLIGAVTGLSALRLL